MLRCRFTVGTDLFMDHKLGRMHRRAGERRAFKDSHSQARALERSETTLCQRRTFASSSGKVIFAGRMKSTATRPVMSATVKASPHTNWLSASCPSRTCRNSMAFGLFASPHAVTCGTSICAIAGWRWGKGGGHGEKEAELDPALPHLHQRLSDRADAEQRRIGLHFLEIAADGDRLGDHRAIVKLERRRALEGVERGEFRCFVLHLVDVDGHARHRDALLGEKNAHPPRVRSAGFLVEFHGAAPDPRTRPLSTPQVKRILTSRSR